MSPNSRVLFGIFKSWFCFLSIWYSLSQYWAIPTISCFFWCDFGHKISLPPTSPTNQRTGCCWNLVGLLCGRGASHSPKTSTERWVWSGGGWAKGLGQGGGGAGGPWWRSENYYTPEDERLEPTAITNFLKENHLNQTSMTMFHVNLQGCT